VRAGGAGRPCRGSTACRRVALGGPEAAPHNLALPECAGGLHGAGSQPLLLSNMHMYYFLIFQF
jgi:hypothetical protein